MCRLTRDLLAIAQCLYFSGIRLATLDLNVVCVIWEYGVGVGGGVSPPTAGVRDRDPPEFLNIFLNLFMENFALWCVLISETGHLQRCKILPACKQSIGV